MPRRFVLAALFAASCTDAPPTDPKPTPDPWKVTAKEHLGAFVGAPPRGVLPGVTRASLLVSHTGVALDAPAMYGLPANEHGFAIPSGLLEINTATGKSRVFTDADGLPSWEYPGGATPAGRATVPLFDLAWIETDTTFAAAGWSHVVKGTRTETGWAFTSRTLRRDGRDTDATVLTLTVAGGEIFVGTDQGLVALAPATLEPLRWIALDATNPAVGQLSAGSLDGAVVAVLYGEADSVQLSRVALVRPGSEVSEPLELPDGHRPTAVHAAAGALFIGSRGPDGLGAVHAQASGQRLDTIIEAEDLAFAKLGSKPFVPNRLAVDETHGLLVIGGAIPSNGPGTSGGLVEFELSGPGAVEGPGRLTLDRRERSADLLPWQVDTLTIDAQGRWYVTGRQLCSERRALSTPLWRIELDGRERRVVAPYVSGVRDVQRDPAAGHTWLVLAEESGSCDALALRRTVCRLKADGSCETWAPYVNFDDDFFSADATVASLAFGDPARRELALVGRSEIGFARTNDTTRALLTTLDPGISLHPTRAAWGAPGALWIGSEARWREPTPGTGEQDAEVLNARSGLGLAYYELGADAAPAFSRRYVRRLSGLHATEVGGLPSSAVLDVLPLEGARRALVASGTERLSRAALHVTPNAAPSGRRGGIAEVRDGEVHLFTPPEGVTFGDVVALARASDGTLLALDAEHGVFSLDLAKHTAQRKIAAPWPAGARGLSLAAGAQGVFAVGSNEGLYLFRSDTLLDTTRDLGFVSAVRFLSDKVLYAGADRGLVRVAFDAAALPERGPAGLLAREPWPLPRGCDGASSCSCRRDDQCENGLDCYCSNPSVCTCSYIDVCSQRPFIDGCECKSDGECAAGLGCNCDGELCTCGEKRCGGLEGCACETNENCAAGHLCGAGGTCEVDPACEIGCQCATDSGCLGESTCEDGFAGKRCRPPGFAP